MKHKFLFCILLLLASCSFANEKLDVEIEKIFNCIEIKQELKWPNSLEKYGIDYENMINKLSTTLHEQYKSVSSKKFEIVEYGYLRIYRRLFLGDDKNVFLVLISVLVVDDKYLLHGLRIGYKHRDLIRCIRESKTDHKKESYNKYVFRCIENLEEDVLWKVLTVEKTDLDKSMIAFKQTIEKRSYKFAFLDRRVVSGNLINERYMITEKGLCVVLDLLFIEEESKVSFVQMTKYHSAEIICEMATSL